MTPIQRLQQGLPADADAALITGSFNRRYLTGFRSSAGTLLISRENAAFLIDSRYYEGACRVVRGCRVILQDKLYRQMAELLEAWGAGSLALESEVCTVKALNDYREKLPRVELLEDNRLSQLLNQMRQVKTPEELALMREAQEITDRTFTHILDFIRPGVTEKQIALELEFHGRGLGADGMAFEAIVASGENSSQPHCTPSGRRVGPGDFIIMDFGFMWEGYCSDMTRTVALGSVSQRQRQVYDTVQRAQEAAFAAIKPGVVCSRVDAAARKIIDKSPFAGAFGHGLGHSLGQQVHEPPSFNTSCDTRLEPGMVLSVEPGVYLEGEFGVRIEDVIVCAEGGFENLTNSPKELMIL